MGYSSKLSVLSVSIFIYIYQKFRIYDGLHACMVPLLMMLTHSGMTSLILVTPTADKLLLKLIVINSLGPFNSTK